jgi:hypothetical protein
MILRQLLDDVLSRRRIVGDPATFALLRKFAPGKAAELNELEAEAIARKAAPEHRVTEDAPVSREALQEILLHHRVASIEEIESLLARGNLSIAEARALRHLAAQLIADKRNARLANRNQNDEWIAKVLGTFRTPFGDLTQAEVTALESIRIQATHAIQGCQEHKKNRCRCWADARTRLFELRMAGDKSPLGVAALAVWNSLESLASTYKPPEPEPPEPRYSPPRTDIPNSELMTPFNWRYWKTSHGN